MATENEFLQVLEANPEDWTARAIYGDWLEEQGKQKEAFCQRWMRSIKKRRPRHYTVNKREVWAWDWDKQWL